MLLIVFGEFAALFSVCVRLDVTEDGGVSQSTHALCSAKLQESRAKIQKNADCWLDQG